jgi:AbrB family looped-hinge helix DNA binding protein
MSKIAIDFFALLRYTDTISSILLIQGIERIDLMNLAKISSNGQITVPVEIRRLLQLKEGDKVLFFQRENGEVVINNASSAAILKAQKAFAGVAETLSNPSEDEIQSWVNDVRYGKGE